MSSSISSSDPAGEPWRRMFGWFAGSAAGLVGFVFLFVALIDPWNSLPLSPPLPRVPVSTNARFTMPALARSAQFDSVVIGSSSSRLLRPVVLDALFGGHFANLAMNAATAWEQAQLAAVFARTHPAARMVIFGLDTVWCTESPQRVTPREFPEWMYRGSPWRGYAHVMSLYAVQEAGSELWAMLGFKHRHYGLDGYTSFVPAESAYDPARVAAAFARAGEPPYQPARTGGYDLPALAMLGEALRALPAGTRKLVFFTPAHVSQQGLPGSDYAGMLASCKAQVTALARFAPNTVVADFDIASPITEAVASYWDPVHYREPVADRLMADLQAAAAGRAMEDGRILEAD